MKPSYVLLLIAVMFLASGMAATAIIFKVPALAGCLIGLGSVMLLMAIIQFIGED